MQNVEVHRYRGQVSEQWQGWMEPADKTWIVFVAADGRVKLYDKRDPATGAVIE